MDIDGSALDACEPTRSYQVGSPGASTDSHSAFGEGRGELASHEWEVSVWRDG